MFSPTSYNSFETVFLFSDAYIDLKRSVLWWGSTQHKNCEQSAFHTEFLRKKKTRSIKRIKAISHMRGKI